MSFAKQWLRLTPVDTLLFKGSEPMVAGENHEARSTFPPMPATLLGALRTAILCQRGIEPRDYLSNDIKIAQGILADYPLLGSPEAPGFEVFGPLLAVSGGCPDVFFPAPAHWFTSTRPDEDESRVLTVSAAENVDQHLTALGLIGSVERPAWVARPPRGDMKSLAGWWVNRRALQVAEQPRFSLKVLGDLSELDPKQPSLAGLDLFMAVEARTGIAMDYGNRRVRQGYLYTFRQVRLQSQVHMLVGLSAELVPNHLDAGGILQLGGERRYVCYQQAAGPELPKGCSSWALAINPIECGRFESWFQTLPHVSGPLLRMAGWDLKVGFHKPVHSYYPAGTAVLLDQQQLPSGSVGFIRM